MNDDDVANEDVSLENLIYSIVPDLLENRLIINSAIVFEMISSDGKIMVSVLHPAKVSKLELASMLISAYNNIGSSVGGFIHEEDDDYEDDEDE